MKELSDLPCKTCPVACVCASKFELIKSNHYLNQLVEGCNLLGDWLNLTDLDLFDMHYFENARIIFKYFAQLKEEE